MTREEAIANLNMINAAFIISVTEEQKTLINDTFNMAIKALEQEPYTGHWIFHKELSDLMNIYKCSECGITSASSKFKYCYKCGARMVEAKGEE